MAKRKKAAKVAKLDAKPARGLSQGWKIWCLIFNLIIPGLGTIVAGKTRLGSIQLVLAIIGFLLWYTLFLGAIVSLVAWVWALITSIKLFK